MMFFWISALLVILGLFTLRFYTNRYSSTNGLLFSISILILIAIVLEAVIYLNLQILYPILAVLVLIVLLAIVFGIYIIIILSFINARIILKRESFSLANSLTLVLGIALLLYVILTFVISDVNSDLIKTIWTYISMLLVFYFFDVFIFLTNVILVNIIKCQKKPDYIIVLGSGLVNGGVSPLLASRIDKAIELIKQRNLKDTKIVLSGGQGIDEPIAEAKAMQEYLLDKGFEKERIIVEDRSTNTYENFVYSNSLIEKDSKEEKSIIFFVTSNYHIFRAGQVSRKTKLKVCGFGGKTAFYYLPTALLREYVAKVMLHKKFHLVIIFIYTLIFVAIALLLHQSIIN